MYQSVRARLVSGRGSLEEAAFEDIDEKLIDLQNQNAHWSETLKDNEEANAHLLDDLSELIGLHERERTALKDAYQNQIDR